MPRLSSDEIVLRAGERGHREPNGHGLTELRSVGNIVYKYSLAMGAATTSH
jgi:hypothetical protein